MPFDRQPLTDFSDNGVLLDWYRENVWLGSPGDWSDDRTSRVSYESTYVRQELDRRLTTIDDSKVDGTLFWSGVGMSVGGAILLWVPPAALVAATAAWLAYAGVGASIVGVARRKITDEEKQQLRARLFDLNQLQRAILEK
jgi:hypothetical protein